MKAEKKSSMVAAVVEKAYVAVTGMEFWALQSRQRRNNAKAKLARKDGERVISISLAEKFKQVISFSWQP
jgi:hypothetical protein